MAPGGRGTNEGERVGDDRAADELQYAERADLTVDEAVLVVRRLVGLAA